MCKECENFSLEQELPTVCGSGLNVFERSTVNLERIVMQENHRIADLHGGLDKVLVGSVFSKRVNFRDGKIYLKITFPVCADGFEGRQEVDGFAQATSASELEAISGLVHYGTVVVLDKNTGELIEAHMAY